LIVLSGFFGDMALAKTHLVPVVAVVRVVGVGSSSHERRGYLAAPVIESDMKVYRIAFRVWHLWRGV